MAEAGKIGAVILAGGKSRRMGENKAFLTLEGKTFLARISEQLGGFEEVLLSADSADKYECENLQVVEDIYPDCGPISGLYSALCVCRSDYLLAVSCDMPLFPKELAQYMSELVAGPYDAFVAVTRDERRQPLCTIYAKRAAGIIEQRIKIGRYSLLGALDNMYVLDIPLQHSPFPDDVALNINTPEQYAELARRADYTGSDYKDI